MGRRNYLFASADRRGERAAAIDLLIGTARLNAEVKSLLIVAFA